MTDFIDIPAEPCSHCLPPSLGLPVNFPTGRVDTCPKCKQPAEPKGVWRDEDGKDHLHFECYGTVTREWEQDGRTYAEREHHHFDKKFAGKTLGA
jgi:hypothetical protein